MAVFVSFFKSTAIGGASGPHILGDCLAAEQLTLSTGVTTTRAFDDNEIAMVVSSESGVIKMARGTTPDAATAAKVAASDAFLPLAPNNPAFISGARGDKLNFKPLS